MTSEELYSAVVEDLCEKWPMLSPEKAEEVTHRVFLTMAEKGVLVIMKGNSR